MNPFDFVPYPQQVPRAKPNYRDVFTGHSGVIECDLEALSPLLVMDPERRAGSDRNEIGTFIQSGREDVPVIPGTSLKGMVRSVAEVLSDSCVTTSSGKTKHLIPQKMAHCRENTSLCQACRVFGFLNGGRVLHGHINIGQAELMGDYTLHRQVQLVPLSTPHPEHEAFYGNASKPAGRKFYFHQRSLSLATSENDRGRGPWVEPLDKGCRFRFSVTFENLTDKDLSLLVAALALTDEAPLADKPTPIRHRLGYGKPAGLGSVAVHIRRVVLDAANRYASFTAQQESIESEPLNEWLQKHRQEYFARPTASVQQLIRILRYPADPEVIYQYPDRDWFNANSQAPIAQTP